jgi:uncharacterized protein YkwD
MRRGFIGSGIGSLGLLLLASGPASGPAREAVRADPELVVVAELVNRHRERVGCSALVWDAEIAAVAAAHSRDMAVRDYYDHVDPDGQGLQHRLIRGGVGWNGVAGENLAIGTIDGETVFSLWLDSRPHRENIENCAYTHHGIGQEDGLWTHLFVQNPLGG